MTSSGAPHRAAVESEPENEYFRTWIEGEDFTGRDLAGAFFGRSQIYCAMFDHADLSNAIMCWNTFERTRFNHAKLLKADLRASEFQDCSFEDADLTEADFRHSSLEGTGFAGAIMVRAKFSERQRALAIFSTEQIDAIDWQTDDGPEPEGG